MAVENVVKFEELLRLDKDIQAKLKAAAEAYSGDAGDEAAIFDATIGALANEVGLPFTLDEARGYAASNRELDDNELAAVAGGGGVCYFLGGSSGPEAECDYMEGHACAYVGVSGFNLDL